MSKTQGIVGVEQDAARAGFHKKRLPPDFRRVQWSLQCANCPALFTANWDSGMKPEAMMVHVRRRQWDVGYGMRPLCPECAFSKKVSPAKKPEHQNFERWVAPETLIFNRLLAAAEKRSRDERIAHNIEVVLDLNEAIKDRDAEEAALKAEKHAAVLADEKAARKELMRQRVSASQKARWERIKAREEAQAAGAEALRIAQLKERACGTLMDSSNTVFECNPQIAPQVEEETMNKPAISPSPKIQHTVFQLLDQVFDANKRLYRSGYTDQRVARDCGTSEDVVAYLRNETFGALAEDPRISNIRDDLELLQMDAAEKFAALQKQMGELRSRIEQIARK